MKYPLLIILFFQIFIYACNNNYKQTEVDKVSNQIINELGKKMKEKYDVHLIAVGGGEDKGKITLFNMCFDMYRPIKKDEARKFLVNITNQFFQDVNNNLEVQPFLEKSPLEHKNVVIGLVSRASPNFERVFDPYPFATYVAEGEIVYLTNDAELQNDPKRKYEIKSRTVEKYEDALEIVRQQGNLD